MGLNAIPTVVGGVRFRSRLEAAWSEFFDFCGWKWEYEPFDLKGYIPDFVLLFYRPIIVEVKPVVRIEDFYEFTPKMEASGWEGEMLLVGATIFESREYSGKACVGLLNHMGSGEDG